MTFSYYPGCTLKTKAKDLDRYARLSAEALGSTLQEPAAGQCRGGDDTIKQTNYDIANDEDMAMKVNNYLSLDEPYCGETKVYHYLEMLRDVVGFDKLKEKVVNPLKGKKIAAYYGCLLLRPSKALAMDDPENPTIIEDFIRAIGAEPVLYSQRNECCGGYITMEDKAQATKRSNKVMDCAKENGAEMVITACPLCLYNLTKNSDSDLPVVYFTELLAEALGVKEQEEK